MKTGIIILGHGSRTNEANSVFAKIVEMIEDKVDYDLVERASMELAEPNLEQSVAKVAKQGVNKVIIIPLFLFPGVHIQEDIPELIKEVEDKYPEIEFVFGKNIGANEKIAEILVDQIKAVG
ncbi:CbiX/SirB N-terminal domain-containing protein [Halanaerocella petrolearia]